MNAPTHRFIELHEGNVDGLRRIWKIVRLLADLNENGIAEREIGYDEKGLLTHRWPGGESLAGYGVLDLAVFDRSTAGDISESEFESLWDEAVKDERFFAEADPYGDRFGTALPKMGMPSSSRAIMQPFDPRLPADRLDPAAISDTLQNKKGGRCRPPLLHLGTSAAP